MTQSSAMAKAAALSFAVISHGALALVLAAPEAPLSEGMDGVPDVRLGNSFQDLAAGTLSPGRADTTLRQVTHRELAAEGADPIPTPSAEPEVTPRATPAPAAPVVPDGVLSPAPPEAAAAQQSTALAPRTRPVTLKGEDADNPAVTRSLRPKKRSARIAAAHEPKPKPTAPKKPATGNARKHASAGEATGKKDATARQSGSSGRQKAAGNAAVSNYPGRVMRKLSRVGKPRINARGTAVVAFTIGAGGGLASVSLARSSGSSALDHAAVRLIQSAGRFPKPPAGARRSFSVQIKGI